MKDLSTQKAAPPTIQNKSKEWLRNKLFEQKKASQIKPVQFHGSRHRG